MNIKAVLNTLGRLLQVEAALMILPLAVALICGEDANPFLLTILIVGIVGTVFTMIKKKNSLTFEREGFI
ncbi:MAG: TrkH family potassium uptake protein, partial [Clostridia bacterium]|nr:TrkH family potassium uptake protein [Clostridia bacterium]